MKKLIKETWKDAVFPYIVYVMFFLGMGLTSGAIVHMPMDPPKYTVVLLIGMAIFVVASLLNETIIDKKNLSISSTIRLVLFSLLLSVGIGMISGGIQHFEDVLDYAGYLIPGGILLSFISFLLKNNIKLGFKKATPLFTILLAIIISLGFTLKNVAATMPTGDGHGHSNSAEEHEHEDEEVTGTVVIEKDQSSESSKKSSYYFTANEEGSISKIDALTNRIISTIKIEGIINSVQISPDGKVLAATWMPKN